MNVQIGMLVYNAYDELGMVTHIDNRYYYVDWYGTPATKYRYDAEAINALRCCYLAYRERM